MRDTVLGLIRFALAFALIYILWRMFWGSFFRLWDNFYYFRVFFFLCSCTGFYYLGRWSERHRK